MSSGACIIASKVGGIPEIIKDNGILIDNINIKKLSSKIDYLIKDNKLREYYQRKALVKLFDCITTKNVT